jgi:hypothetical protein
MFEYSEPNLTVGHNDIGITVVLAKPIDIEKPLLEVSLEGAKAIAANQQVIKGEHLTKLPRRIYREIDALKPETGSNYWTSKHFLLGYAPLEYEGSVYGGDGNSEVLVRAVPYLRIGYRGLLAFCANERKLLLEELNRLQKGPSLWHFNTLQAEDC